MSAIMRVRSNIWGLIFNKNKCARVSRDASRPMTYRVTKWRTVQNGGRLRLRSGCARDNRAANFD